MEIELPDGTILDAPDGLNPAQIKTLVQNYQAKNAAPKASLQEQVDYLNRATLAPRMELDPNASHDAIREVPNSPLRQAHGALGNVVDAMMLGGADEVLAGLYALPRLVPGGKSFSGTFDQELARLEQQRRDYEAVNSDQATAATVAGAVLSPANVLGGEFIAAARSVPARAGRAALTGGGVGGATGALSATGDVGDRLAAGATGAGVGAVAGLALQPGMELLGFGARKGGETGLAVLNTIRNQAAARTNPQAQADKLIARALLDDQIPLGYGPAPLPAPLPGQGTINLGGQNVTALGRQATVAPGPARTTAGNFFEQQAAGAPDRAADAVRHMADRGYYGTVQELDAARRASARPLYDLAYSQPAVEQWTPRIAELFRRPSMRAALARAQRIAAEEGRDPRELGLTFNEAGDPVFLAGADANGQIPSVQTMDYVKRGLDDVVEQYRDRTTGRLVLDTEGRAINNTRAEFVGIMRQGNPNYAAALDAWAGPSHALDAVEVGRDIYRARGNPADWIRRFQQMSPQDQDLARIGFVRDATADLGNVGDSGSVYLKLFGNQNKRAVAEVMFPDRQAFERFAAQMQAERQMLATNRTVMGGSPTSRIDAEKESFEGASNALSLLDSLKSGNPLRIVGQALQTGRNLQRGVTPEVADALANRLFTSDPVQIQRILSEIGAVPRPAPTATLPHGLLRRTPAVPLAGQGIGYGAGLLYSPQPVGVR
jgi:hypothetical protein